MINLKLLLMLHGNLLYLSQSIYVSLQLRMQNAVSAQPCVGKLRISLVLFNFLGGLSVNLNHLIESGMTIYDLPFGTLPFRLFGSDLDTRDLETYRRTYSGYF